MTRWGVRAECPKCQTNTFYLHATVQDVFGDHRGTCHNCGSPFRLIADGAQASGSRGATPESTQVDSGPMPGHNLTPGNHERCTLSAEEQRDSTRLLTLALGGRDEQPA